MNTSVARLPRATTPDAHESSRWRSTMRAWNRSCGNSPVASGNGMAAPVTRKGLTAPAGAQVAGGNSIRQMLLILRVTKGSSFADRRTDLFDADIAGVRSEGSKKQAAAPRLPVAAVASRPLERRSWQVRDLAPRRLERSIGAADSDHRGCIRRALTLKSSMG